MKAVLVGNIDDTKKFYYVLDAKDRNSDGVINDGQKSTIVNFWYTAMNTRNLVPLRTGKFHDYLWDGLDGENPEAWERVFLNKTQQVAEEYLSGTPISTDAMKQKNKTKSINDRAFSFKTLLQTQNVSIVREITGQ